LREDYVGIDRLVGDSLELCKKDQSAAYRNILSWINRPAIVSDIRDVTGSKAKIAGL